MASLLLLLLFGAADAHLYELLEVGGVVAADAVNLKTLIRLP